MRIGLSPVWIAVWAYTGKSANIIFVWNVLLGVSPFLFVQVLLAYLKKDKQAKAIVVLLSLLWLVFFPNAPYMITDFMYFAGGGTAALAFWIKLLYIGSGTLFAVILGLDSLYDMHRLVIGWKAVFSAIRFWPPPSFSAALGSTSAGCCVQFMGRAAAGLPADVGHTAA